MIKEIIEIIFFKISKSKYPILAGIFPAKLMMSRGQVATSQRVKLKSMLK